MQDLLLCVTLDVDVGKRNSLKPNLPGEGPVEILPVPVLDGGMIRVGERMCGSAVVGLVGWLVESL